jgi:hypothetical protein
MAGKEPSIIDLTAELSKLTTFRGLTPQTRRTEREGSSALLGHYRTASSSPASPPARATGKPMPRTSWFTFSMARGPWTSSTTMDRPGLSSFDRG